MSEYILEMKGIRKEFPGVVALDNVSFSVKPGVIHALIGENGAGKSTLMKVLNGVYQANAGEIYINGEKVELHASPVAAECAKRYEVAFNVLVLLRRVKKGETSYTTTWTFKTPNDYKNLAQLLAANFGADVKYNVCNNQAKVTVDLTHVLTGENGSVNGSVVSRAR